MKTASVPTIPASPRCVLHDEQRLHQGIVSQATLRLQFFDELVERHILMRVCAQRHFAYSPSSSRNVGFPKGRFARKKIDEESHHPLGLSRGAVGHIGAKHDLVLARVPRQQSLEASEQRHE